MQLIFIYVGLEQNTQDFIFYLANEWVKRRYVYFKSGQASSFCDLYSNLVFNLQKKENLIFILLFAFSGYL